MKIAGRELVTVKPMKDQYLVVGGPLAEVQTDSGLFRANVDRAIPLIGKVVARGPGRYSNDGQSRLAMQFEVGEEVVFFRMSMYREFEWPMSDGTIETAYCVPEDDIIVGIELKGEFKVPQ